jgi:Transcriptional regulator, AbiEi antitoxin
MVSAQETWRANTTQGLPRWFSTWAKRDKQHLGHGVGTMNDLLVACMGGQFGVFTTADARACGHDSLSLSRLLSRGEILRVGPRAYVDGGLHRASTPQQQHALATRAIVRSFDGRAAASHYSALAPDEPAHLRRAPVRDPCEAGSGATVPAAWRPGCPAHLRSGRVARCWPNPLGGTGARGYRQRHGVRHPVRVVAADAALFTAKTTPEELARWIERLSHRPLLERAGQAARLCPARRRTSRRRRTRSLPVSRPRCLRRSRSFVNAGCGEGTATGPTTWLLGKGGVVSAQEAGCADTTQPLPRQAGITFGGPGP